MNEKPFSGFAITGFVLSFFWFLIVPSVLAVIFSGVALQQIHQGKRQGKGLAIAGLVMGIIGVAVYALFFAAISAAIASSPFF